jgi:predicted RNA binding protein YcfA (HicA-like mRNA interferase family)
MELEFRRDLMPLSGKEMLKLYEKAGWVKTRQKGSHAIMTKAGKTEVIPIHSKELGKGIENKLLKRLEEVK